LHFLLLPSIDSIDDEDYYRRLLLHKEAKRVQAAAKKLQVASEKAAKALQKEVD
jgi:hypothetical protein